MRRNRYLFGVLRTRRLSKRILTPKPNKMGTSKIKSIQPNGTWESRNGTMFKFEIGLEDGTSGEVNSKTIDRWNVGDEVEYTVTPGKYGDRLKLDKAGFASKGGGGNSQSPDIQKRIDASWAIGHAINQESDPEKIVEAAEWLLKLRDTLISKL